METDPETLFSETQRFRQTALWVVMGVVVALLAALLIFLFVHLGQTQEASLGARLALLIPLLVMVGVGVLIYAAKMETQVRDGRVFVRLSPFHRAFKEFRAEAITSAAPITFRPLRDWGGWGIRWSSRGKAYIVSGNRGVLLQFHDGKPLCIGSQRPDELAAAINRLLAAGT